MVQISTNLAASVQALTLSRGLHLITVTSASPQRAGDEAELMLPAVHVGVGPIVGADQVEIISGPRVSGEWLYEVGDMLIVKVVSGQPVVLLTTVRAAPLPAIAVEVTRLDRRTIGALSAPLVNATLEIQPQPTVAPAPRAVDPVTGRTLVRTRIDLHVQNKGDIAYVDNFWAGALGERLAIEAFTITPLDGLQPADIEYAGVTVTGGETGWIEGGQLCGARGQATALAGFAVRLKAAGALEHDCEYRGSFASGRIVGPIRNGAPCRSDPGDRLEAIQLIISQRPPSLESSEAAAEPPASEPPPAETPRPKKRKIGPRFSALRETAE